MNMLNNYSITKITEYISGTIKKKNIMILILYCNLLNYFV